MRTPHPLLGTVAGLPIKLLAALGEHRSFLAWSALQQSEHARNAFDSATALQMNAVMDLLEREDELFIGIIITGAGGYLLRRRGLKEAASGVPRARPPRGGSCLFAL